MTVVFSSSSSIASVAILDPEGALIATADQEAGHKAGGALLFLLEALMAEHGRTLGDARLFVSDVGPGSFTGVRVGVTLAKTLAFARHLPCAGVSAFELIEGPWPKAIPSRKGEWYVQADPGRAPEIVSDATLREVETPHARNAQGRTFDPIAPELLVPAYVAEPSISKPRDPRLLRGPYA